MLGTFYMFYVCCVFSGLGSYVLLRLLLFASAWLGPCLIAYCVIPRSVGPVGGMQRFRFGVKVQVLGVQGFGFGGHAFIA